MKKKRTTKREIARVLRTLDSTKIYALFARIHGCVIDRMDVYNFIRSNAPSVKVYRMACELTWPKKHEKYRYGVEMACVRKHGFYRGDARKCVVDMLKQEIQDVFSPYAKRPMMGHTGLYFCSPVYGHHDYNKARMIDIEGNERFCELVVRYGDKFFSPVYDK